MAAVLFGIKVKKKIFFKWTLALILSNGLKNLFCLLQCGPGFVWHSRNEQARKSQVQE